MNTPKKGKAISLKTTSRTFPNTYIFNTYIFKSETSVPY